MAGSHSMSMSSSSSNSSSSSSSSRQQHAKPLPANLNDAKCIINPTPPPASSSSPSSSSPPSPDELQTLDRNLSALCEHIQVEGWSTGAFSDVIVHAMGTTYCLHRLILSRSSYFRHMLEGPWKEAGASELLLQIDDQNVNDEAVGLALAYLYGYHPKLDDKNAFRVLAAASFLDLQDLCVICTDFIISELHTDNFLGYQTFAESQDYGIHGERVRKACWGFLCRGAAMELKEILPKLSIQTLLTLLISDELWLPNEERRLELALSVLMSKHVPNDDDHIRVSNAIDTLQIEEKPPPMSNKWEKEQNHLIIEEGPWTSIMQGSVEQQSCAAIHQVGMNDLSEDCSSLQPQALSMDMETFNDISRNKNYFAPAWGGRVVERSQIKTYMDQSGCLKSEDWDDFLSLFEGGGILYCHMTFENLLNVRRRLEELDFPCKAVCDGLWLQTLLRQSVLSIGADTCMACSLFIASCNCRQTYIYPHARVPAHYYRDDQERNLGALASGSFQGNDVKAAVSGPSSQGRVHVRGTADGLAALVGLSQGSSTGVPLHSDQTTKFEEQQHMFKVNGDSGPSINTSSCCSQKSDSKEHALSQDWEANKSLSISLDLETPLRAFPPFRFGVEFENVHRLADGQSKHSPEIFYAGSLWKVSAQAFRDEDPHGRRTLGLFLHRRRAENIDNTRKVYLYTDTREKVTARYQLICPSKREVMIFGSLAQAGTLLPKAPKGWGWRTAFLFDELTDLLPGGSLRVAAVIQLV